MPINLSGTITGAAIDKMPEYQPFVNALIDRLTEAGCTQELLPEALGCIAAACITEAVRIKEFTENAEASREP